MAKKSKNVGSRDQNGRGVNYEYITIATRKIQEKYHFCFVRQRVKASFESTLNVKEFCYHVSLFFASKRQIVASFTHFLE